MEKRALVLVAGIGRGPFEALAPVLDRQKLEVVKVAAPEMSVEPLFPVVPVQGPTKPGNYAMKFPTVTWEKA